MRISNNILGRGSNLELKDIKLAQVISIMATFYITISWQSYSWVELSIAQTGIINGIIYECSTQLHDWLKIAIETSRRKNKEI